MKIIGYIKNTRVLDKDIIILLAIENSATEAISRYAKLEPKRKMKDITNISSLPDQTLYF